MRDTWWTLRSWLGKHRSAILWGLLAGILWGLLTGSGTSPRGNLAYDESSDTVVIMRPDLSAPVSVSRDAFYQTYQTNLIQVTLTYLVLCSIAGWVASLLKRTRPRGEVQPSLHADWDIYLISFLSGGLSAAVFYARGDLGQWFRGPEMTLAVVVTGLISFILPLFDGIGIFTVWFLRLESIRAPNWETHIPPPRDWIRPLIRRVWRGIRSESKGGKSRQDQEK